MTTMTAGFFLATLSEACAMTGWRVHAWVLMGNHYHPFIETPEPNLVAGMSWLQNTVTRREADDCFAGVDREKTVHAQRGKREPAVAAV